jgi:WD40 repeat protein
VVPLGAGETVRDALFMADGTLAVLTGRRISLWRADTLEPWGTPIALPGSGVQVLSQAGARGELIAAASSADAPVELFDPQRLAPRGLTPRATDATDDLGANVLAALDPSGTTLATTEFEVRTGVEGASKTKGTTSLGHVTLHDLSGAAPEQRLPALVGEQFKALRFTHRGARLVVADAGGKITAWDVAAQQWRALVTLPKGGDEITLGATADGELLAAVPAADGLSIGREGDGFAEMKVFGDAKPVAVAFDSEGRRVALAICTQETRPEICSRSIIDIHDVAAPGRPTRLEVDFAPAKLVFSANGERLACSDTQRIKVWNLADGRPLPLTVRQDLGLFNGLDLSADGQVLVVSAIADKAAVDLVLLHLDTGEELAPPLRVHNPAIGDAALGQVLVSADNKRIVSSTGDGTVVWDIDDETLRGRACALAGRELTLAEQQRFLGTRPYQALCPGGR